ncbi:hypothetical protein PYW08_008122 [Mythimna loreyi]|uniref:Uncharacterized protein n=1 Tax=Mythimna loreyi TaxID=667449 RepID=A0ACC2QAC0_9NEOP|nr:hypothetical protein PYW08_008122 [Mythimna loreyi]
MDLLNRYDATPYSSAYATRRSKPMFPMYTARATLEIGSGAVCSGRGVTTTTPSNQLRSFAQARLLRALRDDTTTTPSNQAHSLPQAQLLRALRVDTTTTPSNQVPSLPQAQLLRALRVDTTTTPSNQVPSLPQAQLLRDLRVDTTTTPSKQVPSLPQAQLLRALRVDTTTTPSDQVPSLPQARLLRALQVDTTTQHDAHNHKPRDPKRTNQRLDKEAKRRSKSDQTNKGSTAKITRDEHCTDDSQLWADNVDYWYTSLAHYTDPLQYAKTRGPKRTNQRLNKEDKRRSKSNQTNKGSTAKITRDEHCTDDSQLWADNVDYWYKSPAHYTGPLQYAKPRGPKRTNQRLNKEDKRRSKSNQTSKDSTAKITRDGHCTDDSQLWADNVDYWYKSPAHYTDPLQYAKPRGPKRTNQRLNKEDKRRSKSNQTNKGSTAKITRNEHCTDYSQLWADNVDYWYKSPAHYTDPLQYAKPRGPKRSKQRLNKEDKRRSKSNQTNKGSTAKITRDEHCTDDSQLWADNVDYWYKSPAHYTDPLQYAKPRGPKRSNQRLNKEDKRRSKSNQTNKGSTAKITRDEHCTDDSQLWAGNVDYWYKSPAHYTDPLQYAKLRGPKRTNQRLNKEDKRRYKSNQTNKGSTAKITRDEHCLDDSQLWADNVDYWYKSPARYTDPLQYAKPRGPKRSNQRLNKEDKRRSKSNQTNKGSTAKITRDEHCTDDSQLWADNVNYWYKSPAHYTDLLQYANPIKLKERTHAKITEFKAKKWRNLSYLRHYDEGAHRVAESFKCDFELRKKYRQQVGTDLVAPTLSDINPRNVRPMTIGRPLSQIHQTSYCIEEHSKGKRTRETIKKDAKSKCSNEIDNTSNLSLNDAKTELKNVEDINLTKSNQLSDTSTKCFNSSEREDLTWLTNPFMHLEKNESRGAEVVLTDVNPNHSQNSNIDSSFIEYVSKQQKLLESIRNSEESNCMTMTSEYEKEEIRRGKSVHEDFNIAGNCEAQYSTEQECSKTKILADKQDENTTKSDNKDIMTSDSEHIMKPNDEQTKNNNSQLERTTNTEAEHITNFEGEHNMQPKDEHIRSPEVEHTTISEIECTTNPEGEHTADPEDEHTTDPEVEHTTNSVIYLCNII